MLDGVTVAEGVAAVPPGPALSALLDGLDFGSVANDDIVDVLVAQSRQVAFEQARLFAVLHEVGHRRPFAGPGQVRRSERPVEFAADEVRAALSWTRRAAEFETDVAETLVGRLPLVFEALRAGLIDRGRALVFVRHLADLPAGQVEVICRAVLPQAGGWTSGQLDARLRALIIRIDPEYYERRYRKAVRDRQVCGYLDRDGSATVSGRGLPAEEAAAALERVDALARAVRRAGHPGTLDQLRADLFLGLLDGSLHGLSRDQIIAALLAGAVIDGDPAGDPERCGGHGWGEDRFGGGADERGSYERGSCDGGPDDGADGDHGPDGEGSAERGPGGGPAGEPKGGSGGDGPDDEPDDDGPDDESDDDGPDDEPDDGGPDENGPDDGGPDDGGPSDGGPNDGGPCSGQPDGRGPDGERSNDHGPDDHGPDDRGPGGAGPGGGGAGAGDGPGEGRPGAHNSGSSPGSTGRATAAAASACSVRDGPPAGQGMEDQRGGVEIRLALSTLLGHDEQPGEIPGWGPVSASAARAAVARQRGAEWRWVVTGSDGHLISEGITRHRPGHLSRAGPRGGVVELHIPDALLTRLTTHPAVAGAWAGVVGDIAVQHDRREQHLRDLDLHPDDRLPRAALRRHTQIRDRTCVHKGCRAPARGCDQDHTVEHTHGGPTTAGDLAPTCRHDHRLKTEGGWQLEQPEPGRFLWTSPLGRRYAVSREPILPPPLPEVPRPAEAWFDDPAEDTDQPLTMHPRDRRRPAYDPHAYYDPPRPQRAPKPVDLDDEPPF